MLEWFRDAWLVLVPLPGIIVGKYLDSRDKRSSKQQELALDLLLRIETYCDEPPDTDAGKAKARAEILSRAQGLRNSEVRELFEDLSITMWSFQKLEERGAANIIRKEFRPMLGALIRGEHPRIELSEAYLGIIRKEREQVELASRRDGDR